MLADEDEFLHAVAELVIPVAAETWVLLHKLLEFILRHGGIPLAGVSDADLFAGLFKDVAGIFLVVEIADSFGADDALGPFAGHELVEESEVEGTTMVINVGADAVFFGLALIMVMMVVVMFMAMMVFVLMMVFIVVVMVMMPMLFVVVIIFFFIIIVFILVVMLLNFLNPRSRSGYGVEVKHIGIQYLVEFYVAIVAVDDFGLGL